MFCLCFHFHCKLISKYTLKQIQLYMFAHVTATKLAWFLPKWEVTEEISVSLCWVYVAWLRQEGRGAVFIGRKQMHIPFSEPAAGEAFSSPSGMGKMRGCNISKSSWGQMTYFSHTHILYWWRENDRLPGVLVLVKGVYKPDHMTNVVFLKRQIKWHLRRRPFKGFRFICLEVQKQEIKTFVFLQGILNRSIERAITWLNADISEIQYFYKHFTHSHFFAGPRWRTNVPNKRLKGQHRKWQHRTD